jgi:hypothetical protein
MYVYKSLIFAHYRREPVALAILTHKRPAGEPAYYAHSRYGTKSLYDYNSHVLSELDDGELLASGMPPKIVAKSAKLPLRRIRGLLN